MDESNELRETLMQKKEDLKALLKERKGAIDECMKKKKAIEKKWYP